MKQKARFERRLLARRVTNTFLIAALISLFYGLAWNYSTQRYLKGFVDAIVPLSGSEEQKSKALLQWFHQEPGRTDNIVTGIVNLRDPTYIVKNARLLKYCGSATNAFINLADVAGLKTRRLLLLNETGDAKHVVAEVQSGNRWVVVDPSLGFMFTDRSGRTLTKEELRDPRVFRDATRGLQGYNPTYTFERTAHVHLRRVPILGSILRRNLDNIFPGWEETINWGYFAEHPSLWPVLVTIPLLVFGIFVRLILGLYDRERQGLKPVQSREQLIMEDSALFLGESMAGLHTPHFLDSKYIVGTAICANLAGLLSIIFQGSTSEAVLPLIFLVCIIIVARYFGPVAGVLGSLAAAVVFADLFPPAGSLAVDSLTERTNLGWMLFGGIVLSCLFGSRSARKVNRQTPSAG